MQKVSLEYSSPEASEGFLRKLPFYLEKVNELKTDSLIEYTKFTRVEPIVLFDESLQSQPFMPNVMQSLVNIFAGYYLQAVAISCNVGNVEVKKLLGKLSPDRTRDVPMDIASSDLLSRRFNQGLEIVVSKEQSFPSPYDQYKLRKREVDLKEKEAERREKREEVQDRQRRAEHQSQLKREKEQERKREKEFKYRKQRDVEQDRRSTKDYRYREKRDEAEDKRREEESKYRQKRDEAEDKRKETETKYKHGRDIIEDTRKDTESEYRRGRDTIEDERKRSETAYKHGRDTIEDERKEEERQYQRVKDKELYKEREEERQYRRERDREEDERRDRALISASKTSIDDLNTNVNLSAGKTISIEIESNGSRAVIPINIRLIVKSSPSNALVNFLTVIKSDRSMIGRWKRWRAKEISFFKDLLLCQDIIEEEKKAHFSDKEGIFRNLRSRNRSKGDTIYDIVTDNINVASASSIIVMSKDTALNVERAMLGKLDNFRAREKLFQITYSMLILVIDPRWEMVTIYHRSVAEPSTLSAREITNSSNRNGPDINEILMALRAGTAPTF